MTETATDLVQPIPIDLSAVFPACCDPAHPRPLKVGIRQEMLEQLLSGESCPARTMGLRIALHQYCNEPAYLRALVAGAERIDLTGQPAGTVTVSEAIKAAQVLRGRCAPRPLWKRHDPDCPNQPAIKQPIKPPAPELPLDAPLTAENIVSGRLELNVKFSTLPQPLPIKNGMKIGIQTDSALVVATLSVKTWQKLEKAKAEWPRWVASVTGKLGAQINSPDGAIVMLENPVLQVFEKKGKA